MMPSPVYTLSAIQEWEQLTSAILDTAERQVDATVRPARLWGYGGLADLVAATAPGALVGDSTLTKEQALKRSAMLAALHMFVNTPIQVGVDGEGQPIMETPVALMSARRAPAS